MLTKLKNFIKQNYILILILLIGAFLRLYRIDVLMRFIWDEGRDMRAIRNIVVNRDLTLFGPFNEIAGHKDFFGVFHYYLMLLALYLANFNPVGPAIFTALLGVSALIVFYIWLRKYQDKKIALATIAIMAVSPLAVRFNQWPWNPNTLGFFASFYLLFLYFFQENKKTIWIVLAGFTLGLLFQLHYFSIALIMPALLILFHQNKKTWANTAIFGLFFILPNLSFVVFDLTHQGFYRKIIFESFFGQSNQQFVSFSIKNIFLGPFLYLFDLSEKFMGSKIMGILLFITTLVYLWQTVKDIFKNYSKNKKVKESWQLTSAWLFFLLLTSLFPSLLDDYHSGALWITQALVLVSSLRFIFKRKYLFFLILIIIFQIYANKFWREPNWQENIPKLRKVAQIVADSYRNENNDKSNFASFVDPETRGLRFRYFLDLEKVNLLGNDDYPRSEILYIVTPHSWEETKKNPAWELETFREAQAELLKQEDDWFIFKLTK